MVPEMKMEELSGIVGLLMARDTAVATLRETSSSTSSVSLSTLSLFSGETWRTSAKLSMRDSPSCVLTYSKAVFISSWEVLVRRRSWNIGKTMLKADEAIVCMISHSISVSINSTSGSQIPEANRLHCISEIWSKCLFTMGFTAPGLIVMVVSIGDPHCSTEDMSISFLKLVWNSLKVVGCCS